jgi:hypothetical protein
MPRDRPQPSRARRVANRIENRDLPTVRRLARVLPRALPGLFAAVLLLLGAAPAHAVAPLSWSAPDAFDSGASPSAVSCASESLCVAVGGANALSTSDPTAPAPTWSTVGIDTGRSLTAVSCAPDGPCVAVDDHGYAFVDYGDSWSAPTPIDLGIGLTGVSCPSDSLCVAVDESGNVLVSRNPVSGAWGPPLGVDSSHKLESVSCASGSLCVAVDNDGQALASADPAATAPWRSERIDFAELPGVSCFAAGACVAFDSGGDLLAGTDPTASTPSWTITPTPAGAPLTGVSCASSGLCVGVGGNGEALASDDPAAPIPSWSAASVDGGQSLVGASCLPGGFCLAVDRAGRALEARTPAPSTTTLAPAEATAEAATLAGAVDPNDAELEGCRFEYGTALPSAQSIPCSSLPSASGGTQDVAAQLSGLAPNTTYRYRVQAVSARGTGEGAETTFTTAVTSGVTLVHPSPSISGTPAVGQKLTCHTGIPSGTVARVSYAWLRDQIPIPESASSIYRVKGTDSGHHLQCLITATNGGGSASAKSAFVTIPTGGGLASAGETSVGKATFKGNRLSVPVACSIHAEAGCRVSLRTSVLETLRGHSVVAVAAHAMRTHHAGAASVRKATVTLASARAHLGAGTRLTVTTTLNSSGQRLLAARHSFSASVTVSGTVIGIIEAQLARQTLRMVYSHSATHATHATRARTQRTTRATRTAKAAGTTRATRTVKAARTATATVPAATPYMGWDTYFALGGEYSEATVLEQASRLLSLGLQRRGYRYLWLDVGWWHGTRNAAGEITVSSAQWPHGMAWLTRTLHAAGFLVGLYTDAGPSGCGGAGQGSYGHYQQDANTFAAWGFDAVKVDFCGGSEYHLNPAVAYAEFHGAIESNSSHRPMLLSICDFLQPEQYGEGRPLLDESAFSSFAFGPSVGNSWRTDTDVGSPGKVSFADVLRNMDADAAAPQAAGPGHWNDPDYLGPDQGMSATQFQAQFGMWAILAAPLMISDNLTRISSSSLAALRNTEVIAIDQDPAGEQGTLLSASGNGEVWVKPLLGGARAIALLNRGSTPMRIETSTTAAGLPPAPSYSVRNAWTHTTNVTSGSIAAEVPGDGAVLVRVSAR